MKKISIILIIAIVGVSLPMFAAFVDKKSVLWMAKLNSGLLGMRTS